MTLPDSPMQGHVRFNRDIARQSLKLPFFPFKVVRVDWKPIVQFQASLHRLTKIRHGHRRWDVECLPNRVAVQQDNDLLPLLNAEASGIAAHGLIRTEGMLQIPSHSCAPAYHVAQRGRYCINPSPLHMSTMEERDSGGYRNGNNTAHSLDPTCHFAAIRRLPQNQQPSKQNCNRHHDKKGHEVPISQLSHFTLVVLSRIVA